MNDNNSVQNRFTAYLAAAVRNRKMNYYEDKMKSREIEFSSMDLLEKNHTDFNKEFHNYILEQTLEVYEKAEVLEEILNIVGDQALTTAVEQLKQREKKLLYGRVFGGLEFEELAAELGMTSKQAEMAYYYVIRKIRKKLEGRKHE